MRIDIMLRYADGQVAEFQQELDAREVTHFKENIDEWLEKRVYIRLGTTYLFLQHLVVFHYEVVE